MNIFLDPGSSTLSMQQMHITWTFDLPQNTAPWAPRRPLLGLSIVEPGNTGQIDISSQVSRLSDERDLLRETKFDSYAMPSCHHALKISQDCWWLLMTPKGPSLTAMTAASTAPHLRERLAMASPWRRTLLPAGRPRPGARSRDLNIPSKQKNKSCFSMLFVHSIHS